jgi:hypothetical protein
MLRLFTCRHKRTSMIHYREIGEQRRVDPSSAYVVCLDCGKEFDYDVEKMEVRHDRRNDRSVRQLQAVHD